MNGNRPAVHRAIRLLSMALVVVLTLLAGCSRPSGTAAPNADVGAAVPPSSTDGVAADPLSEPAQDAKTLEIFELGTPLPAAGGIPDPAAVGPTPVALHVPALGLDGVAIQPVGVEENGDMEVPQPREVGWYQYGPKPGEAAGSSVLAGHIASGGVNGAFRYLDQLQPGDSVTVDMLEPGGATSSINLEVVRVEQYDKRELPFDEIFTSAGPSQVTLITCGGRFDSDDRSYTDNIVVYAKPLT